MTLTDMRCDRCGRTLAGPASAQRGGPDAGVRFSYHPGDPRMRDDAGVLCGRCWARWEADLAAPRPRVCARCGTPVTRRTSLHLRRADEVGNSWQLCRVHAVEMLNQLQTVGEKLDPETFRFPLDNGEPNDGTSDD